MKNVIFLVIDSLNYTRILQKRELMPFLKELEDMYISCESMYSQAPYTEAAVMSLYCGQNVLDRDGYIERYNNAPKTVFEVYSENGFETYHNSLQPHIFPSSLRRGVSSNYCDVGYDFGALWHYRLEHYSILPIIDEEDMEQLKRLFDDNFPQWRQFLQDLRDDAPELELIKRNDKSFDAKAALAILDREIDKYEHDKEAYISAFLKEKERHVLFSIPHFQQNDKLSSDEVDKVRRIMTPVFKKIERKNFTRNIRNNHLPLVKVLKTVISYLWKPNVENKKTFGKAGLAIINTLFDPDLKTRLVNSGASKNSPSLQTHADHFYNWLDSRTTEKPFFACFHVDDVHGPEAFFTYDSTDEDQLLLERKRIMDYVDNLPTDFRGSITHDLSLIYIDNVLRNMFNQMEKKGLLDTTTIYIMADHGFAFQYVPVRTTMGIDFYLENYHIPFIVVDKELPHKRISGLRESKDIPYTALALSGLPIPDNFVGRSVLTQPAYDTLFIEYCGSGCPDLRRRKLFLGAFNKECLIGVKQCLYPEDKELIICECYDLAKDPMQECNITPAGETVQKLLRTLEERRQDIIRQHENTHIS